MIIKPEKILIIDDQSDWLDALSKKGISIIDVKNNELGEIIKQCQEAEKNGKTLFINASLIFNSAQQRQDLLGLQLLEILCMKIISGKYILSFESKHSLLSSRYSYLIQGSDVFYINYINFLNDLS